MQVGVFSDTHGDLLRLSAAIQRAGTPDCFLHLGDYGSDADTISAMLGIPGYAVRGNCDYASNLPRERVVTLAGANLLLVHGDSIRSTYTLAMKAEEAHCCAVLFGHTHQPLLTASGPILIINPGSLSMPRYGSAPSFGMLSIEGGNVDVKLHALS